MHGLLMVWRILVIDGYSVDKMSRDVGAVSISLRFLTKISNPMVYHMLEKLS